MQPPVSRFVRYHGFSLVELMVGVAIGLLGVLIMMQVSTVFEGQKRTTTTGADAQTSGSLAFYSMDRDVRRAGYGFSIPGILGCSIKRYYDGAPLPDLLLQPVVITKGTGSAPDKIQVLSSGKSNWSVPVVVTANHEVSAQKIYVSSTLGMQVDDILIAYQPAEPRKPCTMFQATGPVQGKNKAISDPSMVEHAPPASDGAGIWNAEDPTDLFKTEYEGNKAYVFNLGNIVDHTYSLDAKNNLQIQDASGASRVVASDIVNLKAQYGTINAAKTLVWGDTLTVADIGNLVAVRLALVARSPLMEKRNTSGNCDATKDDKAPKWAAGNIDISKNPDGSNNPDWQCYRYKTFENVVPLRNLMWRERNDS